MEDNRSLMEWLAAAVVIAAAISAFGPWSRPAAPGVDQRTATAAVRAKEEGAGTQEHDAPRVTVSSVHPHDTTAFTEGLSLHDGRLVETTGLVGQSRVRTGIDPRTGEAEKDVALYPILFGEGSTMLGDTLYVLTWNDHKALLYDPETLEVRETLRYPHSGWGLTNDGSVLYASDGTDVVRVMDERLETLREIHVTEDGRPVENINELEWADGLLLANVWLTDDVVAIDPADGRVVWRLDLGRVLREAGHNTWMGSSEDVANGLAWDGATKTLYATGKCWPSLFELSFEEGVAPREDDGTEGDAEGANGTETGGTSVADGNAGSAMTEDGPRTASP